jgi:hypothetical protein
MTLTDCGDHVHVLEGSQVNSCCSHLIYDTQMQYMNKGLAIQCELARVSVETKNSELDTCVLLCRPFVDSVGVWGDWVC